MVWFTNLSSFYSASLQLISLKCTQDTYDHVYEHNMILCNPMEISIDIYAMIY